MSIDGQHYPGAKCKGATAFFNVDKVAKEVSIPDMKGRKLSGGHKVHRKSTSDVLPRTPATTQAPAPSASRRAPPWSSSKNGGGNV